MRVDFAGARPELAELPPTSAMRLDAVTWAPVLARAAAGLGPGQAHPFSLDALPAHRL